MPGLAGRPRNNPATNAGQGDRGHNGNKPQYSRDIVAAPVGVPGMPSTLSPGAKRVWAATIPLLAEAPDLLAICDTSILADFCEVQAQLTLIQSNMWNEASAAAREAGISKNTKKDPVSKAAVAKATTKVVCSYQQVLDKLRQRLNILRREIGLTPAARSSLKVGPIRTVKSGPGGNPMDKSYFGGSGLRPV